MEVLGSDPWSKDNFNSDIKAEELTSLWIWDQASLDENLVFVEGAMTLGN